MSTLRESGPAPDAPAPAGTAAPGGSGTGTALHRRLVAVLLLVLSLGAVGLVTLGSAADRGPEPVHLGATEGTYRWAPEREPYSEPDWSTGEAATQPPDGDEGNAGVVAALVVAGIALLALIALLLYRMRKLVRPAPAVAGLVDEDELTAVQARAALEEARSQLSTIVNAHDAVIAAWLALERAIAEAGVRRAPSQTTLEFVVAVLGSLALDRSALDRLAHLYRRALFDPQPLVEGDRDEALALLNRLTAELDGEADEGPDEGADGSAAR